MSRKHFLGSETFERVVLYFLLHPEARPHFRALQRHLGASTRPLQTELKRLEERGLLRREREGRKVLYRADADHRGWDALFRMIRAFGAPTDILREAFSTVPGIEAALVFGSIARGDAREESDVDVLLVGEHIPRRELGRSTQESSAVIGREVNVVQLSRREIREQLARGQTFIRNVAGGPKLWIVGDERRVPELAA